MTDERRIPRRKDALRILHIITGLESGGAETVLAGLVTSMDRKRFTNEVLSLTTTGPILGHRIASEGIPVHSLGMKRGIPDPRLLWNLTRQIRRVKPDLIQTWLYHSDLVGSLASRWAGDVPVIWGVHHTNFDPAQSKWSTRAVVRVNQSLAKRFPRKIVCCSEATLAAHALLGYPREIMRVINNGIETSRFKPDPEARTSFRAEIGLDPETPLIGLMARFDPQKDHATFFRAAGILHQRRLDVQFVLCGTGITQDNASLLRWISEAGVADVTHLLGLRVDTPRVTAALDIATCSSSYGEASPLILGEAMSCGIPCVITDLPGPMFVVGEFGQVVPVKDSAAMAAAWQRVLEQPVEARRWQGQAARARVEESYSLLRMVEEYQSLYAEAAQAVSGSRP